MPTPPPEWAERLRIWRTPPRRRHRRLKPTTLALGYVSEKADGVEQVGLARRIGANDERAILEGHIHVSEVAPVGQLQAGDNHRPLHFDGSSMVSISTMILPRLPFLLQHGVQQGLVHPHLHAGALLLQQHGYAGVAVAPAPVEGLGHFLEG